MFLHKSIKIFACFAGLFASSCGFWQSAESQNINTSVAPLTTEAPKSTAPFSTQEPSVYQAEIVLTTIAGGEKTERKIFTARRGTKLRCNYENEISFLQMSESQMFLIDSGEKIYAAAASSAADEKSNALKDFLTTEWLNEKRGATFEERGRENNLIKYQVKSNDAPPTTSEILIFVDDNLKIPVRQEFYATAGEQKTLVFSMELRNLKLEADDKLFELPKNYRKVSTSEFQKTIRQRKFDAKNE